MISFRVNRLAAMMVMAAIILNFSSGLGATTLEDGRWADQFTTPLTSGSINSILVDGETVYAGGDFTSAGGVVASRVARWDGTNWSGLNTGISNRTDPVFAIVKTPDGIVAGGSFTTIGGVNATNLARWNGVQWEQVGSGLQKSLSPGRVFALVSNGNQLFAAGQYLSLNGANCSVAKWDGTNWLSLSSDSIQVNALFFDGSRLFAGGKFTSIGGVAATNVAVWNGANWSAIGNGLSGGIRGVLTLALADGELIAGGDFAPGNDHNPNYIARWDGESWQPFGTGLNGSVGAIMVHNDAIIVGGKFTQADGLNASFMAKWENNTWQPLNSSLDGISVNALAVSTDNEILAGGSLISGGNTLFNNLGRYDGTNWFSLGSSPTFGSIADMAISGTNLYACGSFQSIGGVKSSCLTCWNGTSWSAMSGTSGILSLLATGNVLYAAGSFTTIGGVAANNVAMWNGTNWAALGNGITGTGFPQVNSLTFRGNELIAGGDFRGNASPYVAKWNGSTWSAISTLYQPDVTVYVTVGNGNDLYIGGEFRSVGGTVSTRIARWNGTQWFSMGGGVSQNNLSGFVRAIAVDGTNIFAGGQFNLAGSVSVNNIARWNGTTWSAMGTGLNGIVDKMIVHRGNVYVSGRFSSAGGVPAKSIARWDGTNWFSLGSGLGGTDAPYVWALAARDYELYAGGEFITAGDKLSYNFAIWNLRPQLQTKLHGGLFTASWPTDNSVWRAQFRPSLDSGAWADIPQTPTLTNNTFTIQTNLTGASGYFRLVQP